MHRVIHGFPRQRPQFVGEDLERDAKGLAFSRAAGALATSPVQLKGGRQIAREQPIEKQRPELLEKLIAGPILLNSQYGFPYLI